MPRSKKTRKVGENSPKQAPRTKKQDRAITGKKKDSGKKSGSRHDETLLVKQSQGTGAIQAKKDPRHGSKKPVALTVETAKSIQKAAKPKQPKLTDEQQLIKLEEDPRLNQLLDMLEEGRELNSNDQQWLDKQLDVIESLMDKLGLNNPEPVEQVTQESDDELFARFESGENALNDYKQD
ncbi:MAG: Der GTPase-activating protein YihI [Parashewanella sp.]